MGTSYAPFPLVFSVRPDRSSAAPWPDSITAAVLASADHDRQKWRRANASYGEAVGITLRYEISRDAPPALLRWSEKSACSVRLSGRMAAPTIDLAAKVRRSSASPPYAQSG